MRWMDGLRARLRLLSDRSAEERMDEEIRFHLEMETERYVREGMTPEDARRRARLDFGGVEGHKEEMRAGRTLPWRAGLSLDLRLAWRMLVKYPGLTVVGGLGIALAVATAACFSDMTGALLRSTLPFDEGERVVAIESWDVEAGAPERRILADYAVWRDELKTVEDLGAWSPVTRNLIVPGGQTGPVEMAEMTASGFRATRVAPLLGRTLVEEDEQAGAPPVAVIGYDVWQTRFGGDPNVLGREVKLGGTVHSVVGVMPEGFGFPVSHGLWTPLRADVGGYAGREGPATFVFARLAPGVTMEGAQAELATIGRQMAAALPETQEQIRPRVVPYTTQFIPSMLGWELALAQSLIVLLLVVICVNVAVLVYARTVTRSGEIAVRSALGASRQRIVGQLFAEALVLSTGAATVGLLFAAFVLEWFQTAAGEHGSLSFWVEFGLSPTTVLYVGGLAVLGGAIVGVAPALKATGRSLRVGLGELGGGTGMRLGPTWTVLIVAQVAIAVAVMPTAVYGAWNHIRYGFARADFAAEEFLTARLEMDGDPAAPTDAASATRYGDRLAELVARLEAEPSVEAVTFGAHPVVATLPATIEIERSSGSADSPSEHNIRTNHLDVGFFDSFGVQVLAGRDFRPGDAGAAATAVIVNRAFVEEVLGGRNPIGRQVRYTWRHDSSPPLTDGAAESDVWYEVVGVVSDQLVIGVDPGESEARVYHPLAAGQIQPVSMALRIRAGSSGDFAPRLREITAAVDPTLQLHDVLPFDESLQQKQRLLRFVGLAIALVTLSVVLLSAAGIHAMMSFTVARRRKEIGIQAALGARPRRLLLSIFSRAAGQLAIGLAVGVAVASLLNGMAQNLTGAHTVFFVSAAAGLMMLVGLLATLGPARRGLRIQPMEALRAD